jgi:hypothetical protein
MAGKTVDARLAGEGQPAQGVVGLRRSLTLPYAVLYGMGVTIGAGIYVLIGAAAARAGMQAPLAFVAAAILMGLTAASFAEPAGACRSPPARPPMCARGSSRSAGPPRWACSPSVSPSWPPRPSASAAPYIGVFVGLPQPLIIAAVVAGMGAIAAWGIGESVILPPP